MKYILFSMLFILCLPVEAKEKNKRYLYVNRDNGRYEMFYGGELRRFLLSKNSVAEKVWALISLDPSISLDRNNQIILEGVYDENSKEFTLKEWKLLSPFYKGGIKIDEDGREFKVLKSTDFYEGEADWLSDVYGDENFAKRPPQF